MRKWLAICACTLIALFVVACGGDDKDSGSNGATTSNEPVTLTIWDSGVPDPKVTKQIDDAYTAEHPNVTIKRVQQPGETFPTTLRSAMAARKGPDIFLTFGGRYVLDFKSGTRELDDLMQPGDEDRIKGWAATAALADGKHYMVPTETGGSMMYYNKALFEKAGLDPEAPPTTWDEFLTACDKLNAAGITPFAGGFKDGGLGELMIANLAPQLMTDEEAEASLTDTDWNDPAIGKTIDAIHEAFERNCFTKGSEGIPLFPDAVNEFKAGKAAMGLGFVGGDLHYTVYRQTKWGKDNLGGMMFPLQPDAVWDAPKVQAGVASGLAITKFSENPEVAYDYIMFYTSAANANKLFEEAGVLPSASDADPTVSDPIAGEIIGWITSGQAQPGGPIGAISANVESVLLKYIPQLVSGEVPYADVSGEIQAEADKPQ